MNRIEVLAPAKLNLSLDIVGRRSDGYHLLDMVMQTIDLCDTIVIEHSDAGILLECNVDTIADEDNITIRTAKAYFSHVNIQPNIKISLTKRIPMGAGMGGGSADGAAVLRGLNALFHTRLSLADMAKIGIKVGADIPFCVYGGTARVGGIGEIIEPISPLIPCVIVVSKPKLSINTKKAFSVYDNFAGNARYGTDNMVKAIESQRLRFVADAMDNAFMDVLQPSEAEVILPLIADMRQFDALNAVMTGSGSAVFGLFEDELLAQRCADAMMAKFADTEFYICHPVN